MSRGQGQKKVVPIGEPGQHDQSRGCDRSVLRLFWRSPGRGLSNSCGHVTVIRTSPNVAPGNVVIEMDRIVSEDVEIIGTGS
jgi:hypothetical protein